MKHTKCALALALSIQSAHAVEIDINLAGAEFGPKGSIGIVDNDYFVPGSTDLSYVKGTVFRNVRLPVTLERLQGCSGDHTPGLLYSQQGEPPSYIERIKAFVDAASRDGVHVLIDLHNYARWCGFGLVTSEILANTWGNLAAVFKDYTNVSFGVMNEPHDISGWYWKDIQQAGVNAIRAAGAVTQDIYVTGIRWSSARRHTDDSDGDVSNADLLLLITDPVGGTEKLVYEAHAYPDIDTDGEPPNGQPRENENYAYAGDDGTCESETALRDSTKGFFEWLEQNDRRGYIGEFAVGNNQTCKKALEDFLEFADTYSDYLEGIAWWGGGSFWVDNYYYGMNDNQGSAQYSWIESYIDQAPQPSGDPICPAGTIDYDGNGWGWDSVRGIGCRVTSAPQPSGDPICPVGTIDYDGNGWGWDSVRGIGCRVTSAPQPPQPPQPSGDPICPAGTIDDNGNGWGWDSVRGIGCRI